MSSKNLPIAFSHRAKKNFADILQYTHTNWGEKQMLTYPQHH